MHFMARRMAKQVIQQTAFLFVLLGLSATAHAQDQKSEFIFADLDLGIETNMWVADSRMATNISRTQVPNIPDSAFEKPAFTENNLHQYLGLASMAFGAIAGISAPENYDPDLLNTVHFKAAKASWQLGAAAIGTGLWSHWDDFHLEDGLLDRDNLHVILGTLGVIGYYIAVKGAVDEYNDLGYPGEGHSTPGIFGGAAMLTAIVITW